VYGAFLERCRLGRCDSEHSLQVESVTTSAIASSGS